MRFPTTWCLSGLCWLLAAGGIDLTGQVSIHNEPLSRFLRTLLERSARAREEQRGYPGAIERYATLLSLETDRRKARAIRKRIRQLRKRRRTQQGG